MLLYLDSSAIVKQYVLELGSPEVGVAVSGAEISGTSVISRAEVIAAFRKSVRVGALKEESAKTLDRAFNRNWPRLARTRITEKLIQHASILAWAHDLRGYDSVHLASAAAWQQALGRPVTFASFDRSLWRAAGQIGLDPFPKDLPSLLEAWRRRGR